MEIKLPELSLVVLIGVSGSGKSTFAKKYFKSTEIISSDFCRALVSDDENDQNATDDAFMLLRYMVSIRLKRGLLTVIDATNLRSEDRKKLLNIAREYHVLPVAIIFDINEKICIERNNLRTDRMEMDAGRNFTLYINGNKSGVYANGTAGGGFMRADEWNLTQQNLSFFHEGQNLLQINFTDRSFIGGGYFRITYNTTQLSNDEQTGYQKSYLPGIDGVINLYDSFYIPGNLSSMDISLHFKSTGNISMYVGNISIYSGSTSANITNGTLASLLNYSFLNQRQMPIRIGHYSLNASNKTGNVTDVFLTTSLVQSMRIQDVLNGTTNITRIAAAREVDKIFVNTVLNNTGNRVGLVSYWSSVPTSAIVDLTNNNQTLIGAINNYDALIGQGQRYLCGAIKEARLRLTDPLKKKYIMVMSDGSAEKSPGCLGSNLCPQANYSNISSDGAAAVNEAYEAYKNHDIQVFAVGFGLNADNNLLRQIAACGGGNWSTSANYSGLSTIYKDFGALMANESVVFEYQSVSSSNFNSTLFPDSYIEFNYTPLIVPYEYGEISLKRDGERIGIYSGDTIDKPCKQGMYNISPYVKVTDARMTSYSSNFWTDRLLVNSSVTGGWRTVYNLTDFGYKYLALGDPYTVELPVNLIAPGNNYVCIGTGFNMSNATGGSPDDRMIYSLRVKGSVNYGDVNETDVGAQDDAVQRLIDLVKDYVDVTTDDIDTQSSSIGNVPSMWGPVSIRVSMWA